MPKEVIYSDDPEFFVTEQGAELGEADQTPGSEHAYFRRGVHVGWTRDKHVEVGVAKFEISRQHVDDGHFTSLDRDGINRLIRALRRARDAAFGADA